MSTSLVLDEGRTVAQVARDLDLTQSALGGLVGVHKTGSMPNIFVERLWRTVKYEEVYLRGYQDMVEARTQLQQYFAFYNDERPHRAVAGLSPAAAYYASLEQQHTVWQAA